MATKSNGCSLSNRVFSDGFVDVSDCINQQACGFVLHPPTCLIVLKHNIMLVPVRIDAYARSHARAQVYILAHYNHDTTVTAILAAQLPAGTIIATIVINVMVIQSSSSAIAFAVVIIMMIMSPWIRLVRVSVRAVLRDVHGAVVMPIGAAVAFEHFLRTVRRALGQRLVRASAGVLGSGHAGTLAVEFRRSSAVVDMEGSIAELCTLRDVKSIQAIMYIVIQVLQTLYAEAMGPAPTAGICRQSAILRVLLLIALPCRDRA